MHLLGKRLTLKVGAVVILVEFLVLASLGLYYTERFSYEVDQRLEERVLLPGKLMKRQLLRYESVGNEKVMAELVGEEFEEGMIVGSDGRIYYSSTAGYVGKSVLEISAISPEALSITGPTLSRGKKDGKGFITSTTPIKVYEEAKPFYFIFIKAGTSSATTSKKQIASLFIFGSIFCILLTSLAIIGFFRLQVIKPLRNIRLNAEAREGAESDARIPTDREDEIGSLAKSYAAMRNSINQKIDELKTVNRALEERKGKLDALIQAFPDRVIIFDWNGTYLEIYSSDDKLLSSMESELIGKRVHEIRPQKDADEFLKIIRMAITTGKGHPYEYTLNMPSGKIWLESRAARIGDEDGERGKAIWVARDITYRKEIEQRLILAKEKADQVNVRLLELDRTKSSLVSSVSHELRTPLTSLLGFSKIILKNFSKNFWPLAKGNHTLLIKGAKIVENLNILIHEGDRLTRLINDILDLNRIEMGYTNWREETINPEDIARQAANAVSGQFNESPDLSLVTIIGKNLPDIIADPDRLLQVLLNLLTNAAKFTKAGTVTLQVSSPSIGTIRFEVADTGPGIPESEQKRIFEIFHQAGEYGPVNDKPRGAGLGLAISREIVEHYGGIIWVESKVGEGSTFCIDLPVK